MNPLTLRLKNVGRFADLEIDLPEGLLAVVGSNGSGKSTLVGAIELALFADGSRDLAGCLSPWADRLEIELRFEHGNELYRVRRGYVGGARGKSTLDFDRNRLLDEADEHGEREDSWTPLARETAAQTQQLINRTLGLSRRTFGASAFLGQGNAGAFPEATAADRKGMLGEILDPHGFWPHVASCAGAERRAAEQTILVSQARIADGEAKIEGLPTLRESLLATAEEQRHCDAAVAGLESAVGLAQEELAKAQAAAERVRTLTAERDAAKQTFDRSTVDVNDANTATVCLGEARTQRMELGASEPIDQLEAKVEEQRRLTEARAEALRQRDNESRTHRDVLAEIERVAQQGVADKTKSSELYARADELEANADEQPDYCQTCGQPLIGMSRQKVIDGLRDQALADQLKAQGALANVETLEQRAADLLEVIDAIVIPEVLEGDFAGQLATARKTEARRIELGVLIQGYEEKAARLDELREAHEIAAIRLSECETRLVQVPPRDEHAATRSLEAVGRLRDARTALAEIQQRQARLEQQIETLTEVASDIEGTRREVAEKQREIDLLKLAERAFGRDGIPALIVESVIGVIEAETNRLLEMMPTERGETFRVSLRTQRALKTADHLKETLDIIVSGRNGERAFERYSGGEQSRLNICLRLALSLLLSDRRGAESRLLVIDEIEFLDELGRGQLVDVIRSVSDRFDLIIVASHYDDIKIAFDQSLEVFDSGDDKSDVRFAA